MKQRKHYTAEQKLMILQQLLENNIPISQLDEKYEVHPNDIYNWKKKLFESAIDIFTPEISSPKQTSVEQKEIEKLQTEVDKRIIISDDDCYVLFFSLLGNFMVQ
jgi:transposase